MIFNEMILGGYLSAGTNAASQTNVTGSSKYSKSSASTFDMILGSKVNRTSNDNRVLSSRDDDYTSANKVERKNFIFSSRKIERTNGGQWSEVKNSISRDVSSMKKCNDEEKNNRPNTDDKSKNELSNDLVIAVSQILGINADKLQQLLNEAGISPDMLLDEALTSEQISGFDGTSDVMARLSQLLGLNSEQQKTLSQIIHIACDVISGAEGSSEELLSSDNAANIGNDIIPDVTADIRTGDEDILDNGVSAKLSDAIKERIDELTNKLESSEPDATEEIKRLIDPMTAKINGNIQKISGDEEQDSTELTAGNEKKVGDNGRSDVNTSKTESESSKDENSETKSFSAVMEQNAPEAADNIQTQPLFAMLQNSAGVINETKSMLSDMPVQAKEIISQFIEKASVEIAGGKSEMSVDLKPESLGKISLKVVTENGIVMAKFVAENQQVKEVLESNMHLLKDSLESQGMNVQGFSVSVRQDSDRHRMNWERQNDSRGPTLRGASARSSLSVGGLTDFSSSERIADPYQWEDSTINLTA